MIMNILTAEKYLWLVIAIYWLISSLSVKKSVKRQAGWQRIVYIVTLMFAFSLLFGNHFHFPFLERRILPQDELWKIAGLILCVVGLILALLARIYLGRNWSARVTIKVDHELVQSGPYGLTRNPIYTGFLLAFCGCSMSLGMLKGYFGVFLLIVSLLIKIYKEEKFMQEVFGDKWLAYRSRVKRLIPFIY
jgi:protein-S-isoprenylcysteine O-methyltransferase Ste14